MKPEKQRLNSLYTDAACSDQVLEWPLLMTAYTDALLDPTPVQANSQQSALETSLKRVLSIAESQQGHG